MQDKKIIQGICYIVNKVHYALYPDVTTHLKMKGILILILILPIKVFGQLANNSIGLAFLEDQSTDSYELKIAFPYTHLENYEIDWSKELKTIMDSIDYEGEVILFDSVGELAKLQIQSKLYMEFWCENDGGTQIRPILRYKLNKQDLKRDIHPREEFLDVVGFAMVEKSESESQSILEEVDYQTVMTGDLNADGQSECKLLTYYDDAENCDQEPRNNMAMVLQVGQEQYPMRCCGP